MPPWVPALALAAVTVVAAVVAIRLLHAIPARVRRIRRPETRSIRVIGVGGAGGNAVDRMVAERIPNVDLVACNTDAQALRRSIAPTRLRIGAAVTRGLGSGGDPEVGRQAAEEDVAAIEDAVAGADLVFVAAGLGGGTGSGAAPVVAERARQGGALTVGIVTTPFEFEGSRRRAIAENAERQLAGRVDALVVVPNDRAGDVVEAESTMLDAFRVVDGVLVEAVRAVVGLLTAPGFVNVDFADVRAVMERAGPAIIGIGRGTGTDRAIDAAREALASPLLATPIRGARNVLLAVSGPPDLRLDEVRRAAAEVRAAVDADANVVFGASFDEPAGGDVRITLIATGMPVDAGGASEPESAAVPERAAGEAPPEPVARRRGRATPASPDTSPAPGVASSVRPTTGLRGRRPRPASAGAAPVDTEDFEVPTFLRRGRRVSTGT